MFSTFNLCDFGHPSACYTCRSSRFMCPLRFTRPNFATGAWVSRGRCVCPSRCIRFHFPRGPLLSHYEWPIVPQQLQVVLEGWWCTREAKAEGGEPNSVCGFPNLGADHYVLLLERLWVLVFVASAFLISRAVCCPSLHWSCSLSLAHGFSFTVDFRCGWIKKSMKKQKRTLEG